MKTYIAHLDLDCFFVSVERIYDQTLIGKPVIVGGSAEGRGVVASASYEARKYGIRSAMSARRAFALCPHLIAVHGSMKRYSEISHRLYKRLSEFAPVVEQASIDEFYLDFTGCEKLYKNDVPGFMAELQRIVKNEFQLPCSIGLASSTTLAKIASDSAKPEGVRYVPHDTEKEFLAPLPVSVIPGIGKVTDARLKKHGFTVVKDLQSADAETLRRLFGSSAHYVLRAARGEGSTTLHTDYERKSIGREETFERDIADTSELERLLFPLVESVCATARKKNHKAKCVTLKIRYSDFSTFTREITVSPVNDDPTVFTYARTLLRKNLKPKRAVRLLGVSLSEFIPADAADLPLFEEPKRQEEALKAVDSIRSKFGRDAIGFAPRSEHGARKKR